MDPQAFDAAENGDIDVIQNLHRENPKLLVKVTFEKNNVLHIATREGHYDLVKWICKHIPRSAFMCWDQNSDGNMPLHEAAEVGLADVVSILISQQKRTFHGPSFQLCRLINGINKFGETPLLIACKYGHEDAAKRLLEATTPFSLLWRKYQPCLHVAAYEGHLGVVRLLLNKRSCLWRAVLFRSDAQGANPLHKSIYGGQIDAVREIVNAHLSSSLRKRLLEDMDDDGNCAIHVAIVKGVDDIIDCLMSLMPDCIGMRTADQKTVLHIAVEYDRFQLVKKLLCDKRQDKVAKWVSCDQDGSGSTTLHLAVLNGVDPQLLRYLLSFPGLNVNALNNEGHTPLDIASHNLKQILQGSNAYALNNGGLTPLEMASSHKQTLEEARALVSYRSQFNKKVIKSLSKERQVGDKNVDGNIKDVDTLVASLVATVTFAAIFQIPGGIEDQDKNSVHYGTARLAFQPSFIVFLLSDTAALFTSLTVVIAWIFRQRLPKKRSENKSRLTTVSAVYLVASILFAAIAFTSALFLVVIPPNLGHLKTTHEKAYRKYRILIGIVCWGSFIPLSIGIFFSLYYTARHVIDIKRGDRMKSLIYLTGGGAFIIFYVFFIFEISYMNNGLRFAMSL